MRGLVGGVLGFMEVGFCQSLRRAGRGWSGRHFGGGGWAAWSSHAGEESCIIWKMKKRDELHADIQGKVLLIVIQFGMYNK